MYTKSKTFTEHLFVDLIDFCKKKRLNCQLYSSQLITIKIFKKKQLLLEARSHSPKECLREVKSKLNNYKII